MVSDGQFHAALNASEALLNSLGLLRERNSYHRPRLRAANLAGLDYPAMWEKILAANDYDLRLNDDSVMQFWRSNEEAALQYCWLESPHRLPPFDEYARTYVYERLQIALDEEPEVEAFIGECEFEIQQAFEEERQVAALREAVTPLRYEFSPGQYTEGVHPASHLHVGIENEIRFACRRVLNPMSFVLLVVRQVYPDVWLKNVANAVIAEHVTHIRDGLLHVGEDFWNQLDECEVRFE